MGTIRLLAGLLIGVTACAAHGGEIQTDDPLRAFVHIEYPLGNDYFINGSGDTYIFRCILTKEKDGIDGLALSEISTWGNHTGPWEIFKTGKDGIYVYAGSKHLRDTTCLESCRSREYLASGQCRWRHGWPGQ